MLTYELRSGELSMANFPIVSLISIVGLNGLLFFVLRRQKKPPIG